jgi:hypothetical protein
MSPVQSVTDVPVHSHGQCVRLLVGAGQVEYDSHCGGGASLGKDLAKYAVIWLSSSSVATAPREDMICTRSFHSWGLRR